MQIFKEKHMNILYQENEILKAQKTFENALFTKPTESIDIVIGFQSGAFDTAVRWLPSLGIWAHFGFPPGEKSPGKRYWNVFGLGKPSGMVNIICEINPPVRGINRQAAGGYVRSSFGEIYLIHRGIFNARGRIRKDFIRQNFQGKWVTINDGGRKSQVIEVGCLSSELFPEDLVKFIHEANRVKELARSLF
jgi:hypothetical protein